MYENEQDEAKRAKIVKSIKERTAKQKRLKAKYKDLKDERATTWMDDYRFSMVCL